MAGLVPGMPGIKPGMTSERLVNTLSVMAGLVPAIRVFKDSQDVDARHKAGHDEREASQCRVSFSPPPSSALTPSRNG